MSICLSRLRDTRIEEDSDNSTSSKDLLVRNVFEELRDEKTWSMKCGNRLCRFACRSAPAMLAWLVQECFRGATRRQAFSVVGIKETWRTLSVSEGQRLESHTKTLMEGGLCPESTTSSPYRGRLGGGGCFFASFFAPKKERKKKKTCLI